MTTTPKPGGRSVVVIGGFADSLVNFRGPLIARMVAAGHRVIACAPGGTPAIEAHLADLGASFREIPMARGGLRPDQDLATFRALLRVFQTEKPDVVLAYTIKPVIWGALAASRAGVPETYALITGLGYAFGGEGFKARLVGALVERLYRRALAGAKRVFFQNPDDQALLEAKGLVRPGQAVLVAGSGVDLAHFRPAPLPERPVCLLIARFLVEKGIRDYVEAARRVRAERPDVAFHLVGWCDHANPAAIDQAELDRWIADGVVTYLGKLDDVRPALAGCSIYVLPSYYREGVPRTALEAMASGRAIVTTDAPGCRETVVEGENGYLVPPRDPARLAVVLLELVRDPARIGRMGEASRRLAAERFDVHQVNHAMLRVMGLVAPEEAPPAHQAPAPLAGGSE